LTGAELAGADFAGADVTGADFENADATSARLLGLKGRAEARNFERMRNRERAFLD
jgi:uncharacterized protein YjbI with pentapeptide repeats